MIAADSNDLLVAFAMLCLIVGLVVIPLTNDIAMWLSGRPSHEIGAGEFTGGEALGVLPRAGLSATLACGSVVGADVLSRPFDWEVDVA